MLSNPYGSSSSPEEVGRIAARYIITIVASVILAAIIAPLVALADEPKAPVWETYVFNKGVLSISDQPCTQPVAMGAWERLRVDVKAQSGRDIGEIKQSRLLWEGKVYAGCYAISPRGNVVNIDSLGEQLKPSIPRDRFVPHEGVLPVGGINV